MLQSQKNKLTMQILGKLKNRGVPPVSAAPKEDTLLGDAEVEDEEVSPDGSLVRLPLSIRGLSSPVRKPKKPVSEDEVIE